MHDLPTAAHVASTNLIDSTHPAVTAFARQTIGTTTASPT